jgi:hypothetical protein
MKQKISGCQNGITMYETENNIVRTRCSYQTAGSYLEQEANNKIVLRQILGAYQPWP